MKKKSDYPIHFGHRTDGDSWIELQYSPPQILRVNHIGTRLMRSPISSAVSGHIFIRTDYSLFALVKY